MKKLLIIFLILFVVELASAADQNIYISSSASIGGDGSVETPYDEFSDINWTTGGTNSIFDWITAGDAVNINLKKGDTFSEELSIQTSGASGQLITVQAYGTGTDPIITTSTTYTETGDWTDETGNVWSIPATVETANIIFNNLTSVGVLVWAENDLTEQGEFWYDEPNNKCKIYSASNPGTYYSLVEVVADEAGVIINEGIDYITVQNLNVTKCGWMGIEIADGADYITVQDNEVSWSGGGEGASEVRRGGGINTQEDATNILITRNKVYQCYDQGIALQGWADTLILTDIEISFNVIQDCTYGIEAWGVKVDSELTNILVVNNTIQNSGGWSQDQRPESQTAGSWIWNCPGTYTNVIFKNNIFSDGDSSVTQSSCIRLGQYARDEFTFDYNMFNVGDMDYLAVIHEIPAWEYVNYTASQFSDYQTNSSQDANSLADDPNLTPTGKLIIGSPALNEGLVITGVNDGGELDIWGNITDGTPNIGAYQGDGTGTGTIGTGTTWTMGAGATGTIGE